MNRIEFTQNIVALLHQMILMGEHPIIDFVKRSTEEQKRLFEAGLSKCDGEKVISQHQLGRAMDIYFIENGKMVDPKGGWEHWHQVWESWGGAKMLDWDKGHFEV